MQDDAPRARPASCTQLFLAFSALALQGFGGVLAVAQRVLCEERRWLTKAEFLELL
ncbi:MAG TPA: chromate transporter, partial [Methylibium sp.]|nr:chromate transporter [Methylibium sp.]